jgi:polysaccharide biosynthesis protein PelG
LAVMNVFFYLDKRFTVLIVVGTLSVLNIAFTITSMMLGAVFYGYGFAFAVLATLVMALFMLERKLSRLEYETFMLQ